MQLERLFIAGLLVCGVMHPLGTRAQGGAATEQVILACSGAVDVALSLPARGATAGRSWTFSACANDDSKEMANEDASDPPSGSFVAADGQLAIDVSVPGSPQPLRVRGRFAIGARDADVPGVPGAKLTITAATAPRVALQLENMKVADVARELARATGAGVDGIEHLADARVTFRFTNFPLRGALQLLAEEGKVLLLEDDKGRFAFSSPDFATRIADAEAAVDRAGEANDDNALESTLAALLALATAGKDGPGLDPEGLIAGRVWTASGRDDYSAAERLQRKLVARIEQRAGGPTGADYGVALGEVARLRVQQDDPTGASGLYERALASAQKELGTVHPRLAPLQHALAGLRQDQKRVVEAQQLYHQAIDGYEAAGAGTSIELREALVALGWLYLAERRPERAVPLFARDLELVQRVDGVDESMIADAGEPLADALIGSDQLQRAAPLLERAIAASEDSPERARMQHELDAIRALGSYASDGAPGTDAGASLRAALDRGVSKETRNQMTLMMMRRAILRHRAAPGGSTWRPACEAWAEVFGYPDFKLPAMGECEKMVLDSD